MPWANLDWNTINGFSGWLSGVGTLMAVWAALWLARKDNKIQLAVSASVRIAVVPGEKIATSPELLMITVVNKGRRRATVTGIGWHWGLPMRRRHGVQIPDTTQGLFALRMTNSPMPVELSDGDTARWMVPLDDDRLKKYAEFCAGRFPSLRARLIQIEVSTSTGGEFAAPIHRSLREKLVGAAKSASR